MIIGYTGLPRSGKSLSVIQDFLLPFLRRGRRIYTNIDGIDFLMLGHVAGIPSFEVRKQVFVFPSEMNLSELEKIVVELEKTQNSLLILDECHEWLSPENWKQLKFFRSFLSMCGHMGHDIVLISQSIDDIWEPLRNRVHETHVFVRGKLGFRSVYEEFVYRGCNIYTAPAYKNNRKDDKKLYACYRSMNSGADDKAVKYVSIWKNKKLLGMIFFVFFLISLFIALLATHGTSFFPSVPGVSSSSAAVAKKVNRYDRQSNVIYVKYVSCDLTLCTGVRADGSTFILPLDYESPKYPFKIEPIPRGGVPSSSASLGGI